MDRIGLGYLDRLNIEFEEVFWDDESDWMFYLNTKEEGVWATIFNYHKASKRPILMVFNSDEQAKKYAHKTDQECVDTCLEALQNMYPDKKIKMKQYQRSNWSQEQFIQFSIPCISKGMLKEDCETSRKPVDDKLFFAGDYCFFSIIGAAHGAYISS